MGHKFNARRLNDRDGFSRASVLIQLGVDKLPMKKLAVILSLWAAGIVLAGPLQPNPNWLFQTNATSAEYLSGASSYSTVAGGGWMGYTQITLGCWVNFSGSIPSIAGIVVERSSESPPAVIGLWVESSSPYIFFQVGSAGTTPYAGYATSISLGTWYFCVGTWASGQAPLFYLNGQPATGGSGGGTFTGTLPAIAPFLLGDDSGEAGRFFNGYLQEIFVYNRALQPSEISDAYVYAISPTVAFPSTGTSMGFGLQLLLPLNYNGQTNDMSGNGRSITPPYAWGAGRVFP
jgi:hypothetical protein